MSQCLAATKYNLKVSILPHILLGLAFILLVPVAFGTKSLDFTSSAIVLELTMPIIGIILLTPVFSAEQDKALLDTVAVRKIPYITICLLRILISLAVLLIYISGFVLYMKLVESDASMLHIYFGLSSALFLGGVGLFSATLSNNTVIGYTVPVLFYVIDLMGKSELIDITMFSIMRNATPDHKLVLLNLGVLLIVLSLSAKHYMMKQ